MAGRNRGGRGHREFRYLPVSGRPSKRARNASATHRRKRLTAASPATSDHDSLDEQRSGHDAQPLRAAGDHVREVVDGHEDAGGRNQRREAKRCGDRPPAPTRAQLSGEKKSGEHVDGECSRGVTARKGEGVRCRPASSMIGRGRRKASFKRYVRIPVVAADVTTRPAASLWRLYRSHAATSIVTAASSWESPRCVALRAKTWPQCGMRAALQRAMGGSAPARNPRCVTSSATPTKSAISTTRTRAYAWTGGRFSAAADEGYETEERRAELIVTGEERALARSGTSKEGIR